MNKLTLIVITLLSISLAGIPSSAFAQDRAIGDIQRLRWESHSQGGDNPKDKFELGEVLGAYERSDTNDAQKTAAMAAMTELCKTKFPAPEWECPELGKDDYPEASDYPDHDPEHDVLSKRPLAIIYGMGTEEDSPPAVCETSVPVNEETCKCSKQDGDESSESVAPRAEYKNELSDYPSNTTDAEGVWTADEVRELYYLSRENTSE